MIALNHEDQGTILLSQQNYIPLIVESFLIDRKAQSVSPDALSFYQKKLEHFLSFCEQQTITQVSQITPDLIRRYILRMSETHNQGGVHCCFRPLRTLLLWVESEEIMPTNWKNPIRRAKAPRLAVQPIEPIAIENVRALVGTCEHNYSGARDRAMILGLLDTGARA